MALISRTARQCRPYVVAASRRQAGGFLRHSSTAAGLLPLEGYRVLDMTRVLAGVSCALGEVPAERQMLLNLEAHFNFVYHVAILHSDPG